MVIKRFPRVKQLFCLLLFGALVAAANPAVAAMGDYCSVPPFLGASIDPNVLIVLDNSGSMRQQAYPSEYDPSQFVSGIYYGYFDGTQNYRYNGTRWVVTADALSAATLTNPIASGDFLNWVSMRRIDVAKKLLIGGKAAPRVSTGSETVKLLPTVTNTNDSNTIFSKDFDSKLAEGGIAPFSGYYRYEIRGDQLQVISLGGSEADIARPSGSVAAPASWQVSASGAAWQAVNEAVADDDASYIGNASDLAPILFDYSYSGQAVGEIQSVVIRARARKTNPDKDMEVQAVVRVSGSDSASASQPVGDQWSTYRLLELSANPLTGDSWQWPDIQQLTSGALEAYGVQAGLPPSNDNRLLVTQVSLEINIASENGGPYQLVVDQGQTPATGLLHNLKNQARFGLAFYNVSEAGRVVNDVDFNSVDAITTSIDGMYPETWTPLAETVFEMINYFRQDNPYYDTNNFNVGNSHDPYFFNYSSIPSLGYADKKVKCAKSFILLLTDGESTQDKNIPEAIPDSAATETRILRDFDEDGRDTTFLADDGSDYLDDVAFWGRTADLRSDLENTQNVYFYPVFMFGQGSDLLKDAAINGGFVEGKGGDGKPGPDLKEYLRDSDGDGTLTAGIDLPRTYFEGDDGYELEMSITAALTDMFDRAASGTAVSLLSSSNRGTGSMLSAYFQSSLQDGAREIEWTGYAQNFWIDSKDNLREDTVNDAKLQLHKDNVIKMYFDADRNEAMAGVFTTDEDGFGGTLEECVEKETVTIEYKPFRDLTPIWEAGKKLTEKDPDTRTLFTSEKVISSTGTTSIASNDFTVANVTGTPALNTALDADASYTAEEIVQYVRGENLEAADSKFRDRRLSVDGQPWRLGDIVNSTPKTISNFPINSYHTFYGDYSYFRYFTSDDYRNRAAVAVMGANDGMVHAFRVGYLKERGLSEADQANKVKAKFTNNLTSGQIDELGDEIWGYIPFNAFPYLKYLANPAYCHIYYNDLSLRLLDASIGGAADGSRPDSGDSWKSLLLGGMRFGGSCPGGTPMLPITGADVGHSAYYVLDVTNPEGPVPLWEFSDDDLGYATSYPTVARTGAEELNGAWYMVVGSGSKQLPKGSTDIGRDSTGYLYFIDLKTGELKKKIGLGHNAIVGDILSVDADKDYHSEKLYFGTSYKSGGTWRGKLMSLSVPSDLSALCGAGVQRDSGQCGVELTVLFDDVYPFTASPDAIKGEKNQTWVFQGSGKYYSDVDGSDTSEQIFLGFKDLQRTVTLAETGMVDTTDIQTTGATINKTANFCLYNEAEDRFKKTEVILAINSDPAPGPRDVGWYLRLTGGERVISRPLGFGGLVDFLTYSPSLDPCSFGGDTSLYALDYRNGLAPPEVAIPINDAVDQDADSGEYLVKKGVRLGPGAPPTGEGIILTPQRRGDKSGLRNKKIQVGSGVVYDAKNNPIFDVNSQIIHWLEK